MEHGAITVKQFCEWAGIGLTKTYDEINAGRLTLCKVGRKSMIRMVDAHAWLSALPVGKGPTVRDHGENGSEEQTEIDV